LAMISSVGGPPVKIPPGLPAIPAAPHFDGTPAAGLDLSASEG
jgi:hypothetical protein